MQYEREQQWKSQVNAVDSHTSAPGSSDGPRHEMDTVSLLDLLNVLARRKWLIIGASIIGAVLVLAFLLVARALPPAVSPLPDYYRSEALALIDTESASSADQLLASSGLGSLLNADSLGGRSHGQLALQLLQSNSLLDRVAQELGMPEQHADSPHPISSSRAALLSSSQFDFDQGTGILSISYQDTEPAFARDAANEFMQALERRFGEIGLLQNTSRSVTLATKLREVESQIASIEDELISFQRTHNLMSVQGLAEERAQLLGRLRSDLVLKNVEINAYRDLAPANDPVILRLTKERDSLLDLIRDLEDGSSGANQGMPSQQEMPDLAIQYARLQRDLAVQTEIYTALSGQYELTRLEATDERDVFQVLEAAELPEIKAGPSRSMIAIIVTITAFFLAVFLAFVLEYFASAARDPEEGEKLQELRRNLGLGRGPQ